MRMKDGDHRLHQCLALLPAYRAPARPSLSRLLGSIVDRGDLQLPDEFPVTLAAAVLKAPDAFLPARMRHDFTGSLRRR
jgi:hypothetical protein